jgi:hypothetical protein
MIDRDKVTGYPLDNLAKLGRMLVMLRHAHPDLISRLALTLWKSDIAEAYRLCPLHPAWQIKQAIRVGSEYYVDRRLLFGSSGSPAIFISFNSLVSWIAKNKRDIPFLTTYLDDSSGCAWSDDLAFYSPFNRYLPSPQVRLLQLWDELGIPHKEKKQLNGPSLPIIGIQVDANALSYTLPDEARAHLVGELVEWTNPKGLRRPVRRWQQLAGWFNWALNVYPLLRPALSNVYYKLRQAKNPNSSIWVNNDVRDDLRWALNKIEASTGLLLLDSVSWSPDTASFTIYCDACPTGMGFWYPALDIGFHSKTPPDPCDGLIFYFEALCVLCALLDAHTRSSVPSRFVLYTDNLNTVDIFNSLNALPEYNGILRAAVDLLYEGNHDLRVLHVPGAQNAVADALSRAEFERAKSLRPHINISVFEPYRRSKVGSRFVLQPPLNMLGALKK